MTFYSVKIEQIKLKYEFKYKNKFNNNQDNLKDKITSNKNIDINKSKNKIDEDDYNLEVIINIKQYLLLIHLKIKLKGFSI